MRVFKQFKRRYLLEKAHTLGASPSSESHAFTPHMHISNARCLIESCRSHLEIPGGHVHLVTVASAQNPTPPPLPRAPSRLIDASSLHMVGDQSRPPGASLAKRLAFILRCRQDIARNAIGPLNWPAEILPFQIDGISAILNQPFLLLADDMGLGKTIQMIAALRIEVYRGMIRSALIVAPAGLLDQWKREMAKWAPELTVCLVRGSVEDRNWMWRAPAYVHIVSYDTFRFDHSDHVNSPINRRTWDIVILDEAQKIKNSEVETARRCKRIPRTRAVAMTGTPLENRVEELASILEFLQPYERGDDLKRVIPGPGLTERHRQLQVRRRKQDVLPQLPEKTIVDLAMPLQPQQRQTYEEAEHDGILRLREQGRVPIASVLELIMRLKQICNFCPASGESAKMIDIRNRLGILIEQGHRALIFSQFTDSLYGCEAICRSLADFYPIMFTGALSQKHKDEVVREFRTNPRHGALVLSLRSGGVGLNLQEASYVFHFDRWWNPAIEHQAEDRSHRMGQRVPVHVYRYISEATIEERIDRILKEKRVLFQQLIDGISLDLSATLSYRELLGLFGIDAKP